MEVGNAAFAVQYSIFVQYQLVRCPKTLIFLMFQKVSLSNPIFSSSGVDKKVLGRLLGAGSLLFGLFLFLVTRPGQTILNEYQYRRIMAWLSPAAWAEEAYQQAYSVLAIGSGGMAGRLGDALGTMPAVIKSGFLPEPHTDFIMAAAGQELGIAVNVGIQRKQSGSGRERKNIVHW